MNEEIIFPDDERAATYRTNIEGWVSRHGIFYGKNEWVARSEGSTHNKCKDCGEPAQKHYLLCPSCRDRHDQKRYDKMEIVKWDTGAPLYSISHDTYFYCREEIDDYMDEMCGNVTDQRYLQLVLCEKSKMRRIDDDYWNDCFHDDWDGKLPRLVQVALDRLNKVLDIADTKTWIPTTKAVRI